MATPTITDLLQIYNVRDFVSLAATVAHIGSESAELQITRGTHKVAADLTVPANVTLRFVGGKLEVASGVTLTINGPLDAPLAQIFSGAGSVSFGAGAVKVVYPEWWGAKADGATNSTTAIQSAVAAAVQAICRLLLGRYIVDTPIAVKSNTRVEGCGPFTIVEWSDGAAPSVFRNQNYTDGSPRDSNIVIRDLQIVAGTAEEYAWGGGVHLCYVDGVDVSGVTVGGGNGNGITVSRCTRARVENNIVDGCAGVGIDLSATQDFVVVHNEVASAGQDGIACYSPHNGGAEEPNCLHGVVLGNYLHDGGGIVVGVFNQDGNTKSTKYINVIGNIITNSDIVSILVSGGAAYVNVADNIIREPDSIGIQVYGGSHTIAPAHINIRGNTVESGANLGIYLSAETSSLTDISIQGNIVRGNALTGIYIYAHTNSLTRVGVIGNRISNNNGYGVNLFATSNGVISNCQVEGNDIWDDQGVKTQSYPVSLYGNNGGSVSKCTVIGNDGEGNINGFYISGSGHIVKDNIGYVSENGGTASVANGGTINHGLAAAPTQYVATPTVSGHIAMVTAVSATTLTIALLNHDGTPVAVAENINWRAWV